MTTYYVSSIVGSDNNAGTSAGAPLASLQAAEGLVKPGDTVQVMNGTYVGNAPGGGDVLDVTTSGTASAPITFEAAPGQTPVINSSGGWNAINIEASYIVINGFTVVGDAANYTLAQAMAGYSTGNAALDGNGIAINGGHVTVENNTVYNEPGGGIYTEGADYVQILNNVVHDNAHWSAFGNSGISISTSANLDTNPGAHIIVSGNTVFGNAQLVPTTGNSTITDGEGIILDTNPDFTSEILVQNNTVYNNGSSGIESFLTNNAVITGNTLYGNNTENVQAPSNAEIFINQSSDNTVTNNTIGDNSVAPTVAITSAGGTVSSAVQAITGTVDVADAGSEVTILDGTTPIGTGMADANGNWSANVTLINQGANVLTATDTNAGGTGTSKAITYTLSPSAALTNGNFATGTFSGWTLGGNYTSGQIFIDTNAEGGSTYAAGMGSMGSDGTLSQTIATTVGQTYTLSFWLQNEASGGNDFTATWNGQTLLSLADAAQSGYKQYTYTVTATGSSSTLEFSAQNNPSQWDLDNVSLTASGTSSTPPPPPPATTPTLSIANSSLSVTGRGGTVGLGITVTAPPAATATTVTIAGLPRYEVITDGLLDGKTFNGTSIVLSEAEANSGLTLTSNYKGHEHPVATLTVTASDTIDGVPSVSTPQTITVTDPPPSTSTAGDLTNGGAENGYFTFEPFHGAHAIADFASPNLTNSDWAGLSSLLTGDKNMGSYLATGSAYGEEHDLLGLNVAAVAGPKANSVSTGDAARWA